MEDEWRGDNPFYLLIRHPQPSDGKMVQTVIDLDDIGWQERNAEIIGLPGRWYLVRKHDRAMPVAMVVKEGERPYYKARHVGMGAGTPDNTVQAEVIAYGLGKQKEDDTHDQIWHFFPGDVTCAGDDVNPIGTEVLKMSNAIMLVERRAKEVVAERKAAVNSQEPTPTPDGD